MEVFLPHLSNIKFKNKKWGGERKGGKGKYHLKKPRSVPHRSLTGSTTVSRDRQTGNTACNKSESVSEQKVDL